MNNLPCHNNLAATHSPSYRSTDPSLHHKEELADMALLAEAAYADFSEGFSDEHVKKALTNTRGGTKMSEAQASLLTDKWNVIAYWDDHTPLAPEPNAYSSDVLLDSESGFSGTLFKSKQNNQYVLALEGTEEFSNDLIKADLGGIVFNGLAYNQIIDMYNFWQQINQTKGETYEAASVNHEIYQLFDHKRVEELLSEMNGDVDAVYSQLLREAGNMEAGVIVNVLSLFLKPIHFMDSTIAYKTSPYKQERIYGLGLNPGNLTVVGHSLGGHLAVAFSRLFPNVTNNVYIFNGAGYADNYSIINGATKINNITNLFSALNGKSTFDSHKIINFVGNKNIDIVAQNWQNIGLSQKGKKQQVYIENGSPVFGHGMSALTDSLTVMDLFDRIGLSANSIEAYLTLCNPLLITIENGYRSPLGYVIKALARIYLSEDDYQKEVEGKTINRAELYKIVKLVRAAIDTQKATMFTPLVGKKSIIDEAALLEKVLSGQESDIGYRYAMVNLLPFAVIGVDYDRFNQNRYLEIYDSKNKTRGFGFTEQYLRHRLFMLGRLWSNSSSYVERFEDQKSGIVFGAEDNMIAYQYIFGSHENNFLNTTNVISASEDTVNIYGGTERTVVSLNGREGYVELLNPTPNDYANSLTIREGSYEVFDPLVYIELGDIFNSIFLSVFDSVNHDDIFSGIFMMEMGAIAVVTPTEEGRVSVVVSYDGCSVRFNDIEYTTLREDEAWDLYYSSDTLPFTFLFRSNTAEENRPVHILTRTHDVQFSQGTKIDKHLIDQRNVADAIVGIAAQASNSSSLVDAETENRLIISGSNDDDVLVSEGEAGTISGKLGNDIYHITLKDGNRITLIEEGFDDYDKVIFTNLAFADASIVYTDEGLEIQSALGTVILSTESMGLFEELVFTDRILYQSDIEQLLEEALENYPPPQAVGVLSPFYVRPNTQFEWMLQSNSFQNIRALPCYFVALQTNFERLPDWLSFDNASGKLTGNAPENEQTLSLIIFAISAFDRVASHTFSLIVSSEADIYHVIDGTQGNDILYGSSENDIIHGKSGNDHLYGNAGDDILIGGPGNDYLEGGIGSDVYLFSRGDGQDTINNFSDDIDSFDVLRFTSDISPEHVKLKRQDKDLMVRIDDTDDSITVLNFFEQDGHTKYAIDAIEFADGTVWSKDVIKARVLIGDDSGNILIGYDSDDILWGGAGNDTLYGHGGDDILYGGSGVDYLDGGPGSDTYLFARGDQHTVIYNYDPEPNKKDVLRFADDILPDDVTLERSLFNDLILRIKETSDWVRINKYFVGEGYGGYAVDEVQFADGTVWTIDDVLNATKS